MFRAIDPDFTFLIGSIVFIQQFWPDSPCWGSIHWQTWSPPTSVVQPDASVKHDNFSLSALSCPARAYPLQQQAYPTCFDVPSRLSQSPDLATFCSIFLGSVAPMLALEPVFASFIWWATLISISIQQRQRVSISSLSTTARIFIYLVTHGQLFGCRW